MQLILKQELDEILPSVIEFNYDELCAEVRKFVAKYEGKALTPQTLTEGKADRAALNRLVTAFDEARKRVKARCLAPYEAFETKVRDLQALVTPARDAIDTQLKAYEEARRAERRGIIETEYDIRIGDLREDLPLDRIFDAKWLNATCSEATMMTAMQGRIDSVRRDLASLADIATEQYLAAARHEYFRTLDLPATLGYIRERKEADARFAARAAAEKARAEAVAANPPAPPAPAPTRTETAIDGDIVYVPDEPPPTDNDPQLTFTLRFTGRRSAMLALREFMRARGIAYERVD